MARTDAGAAPLVVVNYSLRAAFGPPFPFPAPLDRGVPLSYSVGPMTSYIVPETGPLLASEADALDTIGEALRRQADLVVIPVGRLSPDFFRLASGLAGAMLQKFTNYQLRVAIVGDISAYTAKSAPLRDFVGESNRRGQVRFLTSPADL